MKAILLELNDEKQIVYQCLCESGFHAIPINSNVPGKAWTFNGDFENPTLNPSIKQSCINETICHHFLKNGNIEFCSDTPNTPENFNIPDVDSEQNIKGGAGFYKTFRDKFNAWFK